MVILFKIKQILILKYDNCNVFVQLRHSGSSARDSLFVWQDGKWDEMGSFCFFLLVLIRYPESDFTKERAWKKKLY